MNSNIWKKGLPTEAGFYWFRNTDPKRHDGTPIVLKVRNYAGSLAVDNCIIEGCTMYEKGEWAGPIPLPQEQSEA
jgi:hypothetical protein